MRYFEKQRHEFIAEFIKFHGKINRADIMQKFGISMPQASTDLSKFQKANPKAIKYNTRTKQYERVK